MSQRFPAQKFLDYLVKCIAHNDIAQKGGLAGSGISGIRARKLRRTICSLEKRLAKAYADQDLRPGGVSMLWPVGVECYERMRYLDFQISAVRQSGLLRRERERETELFCVASLFSPIPSVNGAIRKAGGVWREPRTIAERIRSFQQRHGRQYLIGIVERHFDSFKSAQFREAHPGKARKVSAIGSRITGLTQREIDLISKHVRERVGRKKT
jgi:hypothetical protein